MVRNDSRQVTQFFTAIANGQHELVREMVAANRNLLFASDTSCFGATPLTRCCSNGNREMIATLLDLGADIEQRSDWHMGPWSPLQLAVCGRKLELAQFLIERGARLDAHGAAGLGMRSELAAILDDDPTAVHQRGGDGCQPLHFAENLEVAELLLERGADIEARCVDHFSTPVQYLASSRPWVARYLFSRGAKPDIFSAAMAGDQTAVQQLIVANPLVLEERINHVRFPPSPEHDVHNIMTFSVGEGCGPVHAAVAGNQPGMIRLLISLGQSPNQRGGYDEQTPLHLAAWNNHVEAATALLDGGADIDIRSGSIHNNSPAGWAIVAGSADVFELLMDRGAKVLDWFADDARAALRGEFQKFKCASTSDYQRICTRLFNTLEI